jgi:hypothetical protein
MWLRKLSRWKDAPMIMMMPVITFFEPGSGLKPAILLLQPPECWD